MTEEDKLFSSLGDVVSEKTLQAIREMGFTAMMEIQNRSIRPLLLGKSVNHKKIINTLFLKARGKFEA